MLLEKAVIAAERRFARRLAFRKLFVQTFQARTSAVSMRWR